MVANDQLLFRIYSEPDGKIYLLYEPKNWRVEVEKPLTDQSLDAARKENATPQQRANRQIKAVVEPSSPLCSTCFNTSNANSTG